MEKLLCPSMMCADFGDLAGEVSRLEKAGADLFHLDLMDGHFVPNFGLGLQDMEYVCSHSRVPCDIHMMCVDPDNYVEKFAKMGIRIIYVHAESGLNITRTLQRIRDAGAQVGVAISPATAGCTVEPLLNLADYVLVMTVNPGFAGQSYLPFVDDKIDWLLERKEKYGYELVIDGACSPQVIARLSAKGVKGFVLGTSALFGKGRSYAEIMSELRAL